MKDEKFFKTKTGFCHVLSDNIILTRDGIPDNVTKATTRKGIYRILIMYSVLSIFLFYSAYSSFQKGENSSVLFFCTLGMFFIYGIFKSINNSDTPIIERSTIKEVQFINAKFGLTRSRFEIMFEDENRKLKKRLILLPGSLNDGENETKKAVAILKSEGLIAT